MNPQNTSFIPKRPTQGTLQNRGVRKIYILSYVSYILFFGALVSAALVFLYTYTLQAKVNVEKTKLTQEQSQFGQGEIDSILRLEKLIKTAEAKMDTHISLPHVFTALESSALNSLVFTSFDYKRVDDGAPLVKITGEAKNFNSVLFQREILGSNSILAKSAFTKIEIAGEASDDVENEGQSEFVGDPVIAFEISSDIDPALVSYTPQAPVVPSEIEEVQTSDDSQLLNEGGVVEGDASQTESESIVDVQTDSE